jgi:CheY-like chemotaxis protein
MKAQESYRFNGNQKHSLANWWSADMASPRVLVAEDDEAMRSLLVDALRDRGFEVVEAKDGREALNKAVASVLTPNRCSPFDVLLLDVYMPMATGLEVLERLRDAALSPSVIIMSAFVSDEMYAEAERLGCVTIVRKPFPLEPLMDLVSEAARCSG